MLCSWNPEHPCVNLTGNGRHLALERWGKRGEKNRARRQITETKPLKKIHFSLHGITWYQHKPLPLSPSSPFPQHRHYFSEIKIMDLWRHMANNSTSLHFRGWTLLLLKTVLLRWWSHNHRPTHSGGTQAAPLHRRQICLLLAVGSRSLVVERREQKGGRSGFLCCGTLSIYLVWSPSFRGRAEQDHVWVSQMTRKGKLACSFALCSQGLPRKSMATTQTSSSQSKGTSRKPPPHIISHNKHWLTGSHNNGKQRTAVVSTVTR